MRLLVSAFSIIIAAVSIAYFDPSAQNISAIYRNTGLYYLEKLGQVAATNKFLSKSLSHLGAIRPSSSRSASTAGMSVVRNVQKHFLAREQAEGVGARVRRSIGGAELRNFSPFLMLDHFSIKPGVGFPDHPHHGQETITYLLEGAVDHEDFTGSAGTIEAGDLQFMTAGKGIMHAEMPNPNHAKSVGMQLWVDLPRELRKCDPRYRDLKAAEIPTVEVDSGRVTVKVISGKSHGVDSVKDLAYTPVWILDITVRPGGTISQPLPEGWNAFAYVLEGTPILGSGSNETVVPQYHNAVFESAGDSVVVRNNAPDAGAGAGADVRIMLIAGQPLEQQTIQAGPFVADSQEDLRSVYNAFYHQMGSFKRAEGWESEIGKAMVH